MQALLLPLPAPSQASAPEEPSGGEAPRPSRIWALQDFSPRPLDLPGGAQPREGTCPVAQDPEGRTRWLRSHRCVDGVSVRVSQGRTVEPVAQDPEGYLQDPEGIRDTGAMSCECCWRASRSLPGPQFHGIELVYMSDLDTAALYAGAAGSLVSEVSATLDGPRFFGVNGGYVLKAIHRDRYFYKKPPFSPSKQPYTHIMLVDIWHNNPARSRRRQFIVTPTAAAIA